VVVDWQEQMVLQRILQPSIARVKENLTRGMQPAKHHRSNQPHQAFT